MAVGLQGLEHPRLLQRSQLGEHGAFLDPQFQDLVVHVLDVLAKQRQARLQSDLAADLAGDDRVVAGQDLDGDTDLAQGGNRRAGGFLRRIEEGQEAADHQFAFIRSLVLVLALGLEDIAGGDQQDAETVLVVVVGQGQQLLAALLVEGHHVVACHHMAGDGEHFLDRALADQQVIATAVLDDDRQAPTDEVERQLIDLAVGERHLELRILLGEAQHRLVHQVLHAALVMAVQPGQAEDRVIALPVGADMVLEDDLVLGQGAGLVGAQHIHRAEVLDRVQTLDHHLAPGHGHGALGEVGADDHR